MIPLLPVAWTLAPGSRLRLSVAGADAGHFPPMPCGRLTVFEISTATSIELPVRRD